MTMKNLKFKKQPRVKTTDCFTRRDIEEYFNLSSPAAKAKIKEWYKKGYLKFAGRIPQKRIDGVTIKIPAYNLTPLGIKKLTTGGRECGL